MISKDIKEKYSLWVQQAIDDIDLVVELENMKNDEILIEDAFYKNISFGTGGLRGVIGAGTNRINIYTVSKATQALANHIIKNYEKKDWNVVIGYDSRIKSDVFAKVAASVFAANGIQVNIFQTLIPVPCVSYATRYLKTSFGVMITASHNPSKYNGYKVYNKDGCQITTIAASEIYSEIKTIDEFSEIKKINFQSALNSKKIKYIKNEVIDSYIDEVKKQSLINESINKNVSIIYSPLNGTGKKPVLRVLKETGFNNITVVKEQENPDGTFPTCPTPNPEEKEALSLGLEYCKKHNADLLLATDPDCDRVGIAVKDNNGEYILLNGNQTGVLLLNYILERLEETNSMPNNPMVYKSIVTTDMAETIANNYSVNVMNTLTGFKFIGEQIGNLEQQGKEKSFVFGLEESYGYLRGTYVRDKDGVVASFLICEMFAYYTDKGISLLEKLNMLYDQYGYYLETQYSYKLEGVNGFRDMEKIMNVFRYTSLVIDGKQVVKGFDYNLGNNGLPKSNVLKYTLEGNCGFVIRPSGTEPKLKIYITTACATKEESHQVEKRIYAEIDTIINKTINN